MPTSVYSVMFLNLFIILNFIQNVIAQLSALMQPCKTVTYLFKMKPDFMAGPCKVNVLNCGLTVTMIVSGSVNNMNS